MKVSAVQLVRAHAKPARTVKVRTSLRKCSEIFWLQSSTKSLYLSGWAVLIITSKCWPIMMANLRLGITDDYIDCLRLLQLRDLVYSDREFSSVISCSKGLSKASHHVDSWHWVRVCVRCYHLNMGLYQGTKECRMSALPSNLSWQPHPPN